MIEGHATPEGTAAYAAGHQAATGHFRNSLGLTLSSVGMGSYMGETTPAARRGYEASAAVALSSGINVLDTAANYRDQASERDFRPAIARFIEGGGKREGIVVASKAGFLHGDCDEAEPDAWFQTEYVESGVLRKEDIVSGHSLAPRFIVHQLERSRKNLGLDCIDVYFLHNPEHQLDWGIPEAEFYARIETAFEVLERAADAGHIQFYGVATWDGLRTPPGGKGHLSIVKLVHHAGAARMKVGGKAASHHLRAIQFPVNIAMTEAAISPTQPYRFGAQTILDCAKDLGMLTLASASLMQMRLAGRTPPEVAEALGTTTDAETGLQFTRSVPGVTTALIGMSKPEHAKDNATFATTHSPAVGVVKTILGTGSVHGW